MKNLIVTSKVIRRRQQRSIDSKGILKQSESEEAPNRQEVIGPISIQVSSAILQGQVTFFRDPPKIALKRRGSPLKRKIYLSSFVLRIIFFSHVHRQETT